MKLPNKSEIQQIAINNSSDIDFKNFVRGYKELKKKKKKLIKTKWFTKDTIKSLILENLKQFVFGNEIKNDIINMYMENEEENH